MKYALPLLFLVAVGCGDNFADVQEKDTIEAYEEFIKNNPSSGFLMQAEARLEDLFLEKARAEGLESYDLYFERFPDGARKEDATKERERFLFSWAEETNTKEGWKKFKEEYPKPAKDHVRVVKAMLKVHKYMDNLEVGGPMVEQVNLAEDPEGPLDGWSISADVTNNGKRTLEQLSMTVVYLDENGKKVGSRKWPAVAPYWKVPVEEEKKKPFKPGDTITWNWTTGNVPDGWARQVRVYVSGIAYLGEHD